MTRVTMSVSISRGHSRFNGSRMLITSAGPKPSISMRENIACAWSQALLMDALAHYRVEPHGCQESGRLTRPPSPAMLAPIRSHGRTRLIYRVVGSDNRRQERSGPWHKLRFASELLAPMCIMAGGVGPTCQP